jgi:hypothetical protein
MALIEMKRIYVFGGVVDLRNGANGLLAIITPAEPDALYVFSNRQRSIVI